MINNIIIAGRLVKDPELRKTSAGVSVANVRIANETGYGEKSHTNFVNLVLWKGTAESVCQFMKQGDLIFVSGHLQVRNYEDAEGKKREAVEINAVEVQFGPKMNNPKPDVYDDSYTPAYEKPDFALPEQTPDSDLPF